MNIFVRRIRHFYFRSPFYYAAAFIIIFLIFSLIFSFNYQRNPDIINFDDISNKNISFAECEICSNLKYNYGDSTEADLVITGVFGNEKRIDRFVRTLRAVGSRASLVLITNFTFPVKQKIRYEKCGAEIFQMKSTEDMWHFYPHSLRYIGYIQYFNSTKKKFNRVLHTDSYDVFFQSDPFNSKVKANKLYFALEGLKIGNSSWNDGWLNRAYNKTIADSMSEFQVSCSGTVIGGFFQFLIYLDTLINHLPFWANGRHSLDQAYHNYLLHSGEFVKNGISPVFWDCNSPILTMHYCAKNGYGKEVIKENRVWTPNGKIMPAIVHQYNLYQEASNVLFKMCPKNH